MKSCLVAFLVGAMQVFASDILHDDKGEYLFDGEEEKHYLLFQRTYSDDCWGGVYVFDRAKASDSEAKGEWSNGHIWTFAEGVAYGKSMRPSRKCDIYGLRFEDAEFYKDGNGLSKMAFEGPTLNIGAGGITCDKEKFKVYFYNSSSEKRLHLVESQTWRGLSGDALTLDGFNVVVNEPYSDKHKNVVSSESDVVWTLEGNMYVNMLTYENDLSQADVVIRHPAIMSIPVHDTHGSGRLKARSLTIEGGAGIYFGVNLDLKFDATMSWKYGIGSKSLISPEQVAPKITLVQGATLTAKETTAITGGVEIVSAGNVKNSFSGQFRLDDDETVINVDAGSSLDLMEASFCGSGRATIVGEGDIAFRLAGSGYFDSPLVFNGFSGSADIVVESGTLVVDSVAELPADVKITTTGNGALLVVDETGFDADSILDGTKNLVEPSRLLVTNRDVQGEVVVNSGETLLVFGNGLGANAQLKIWGGILSGANSIPIPIVMFYRTATILSQIWSTNTVYVKTFDSSVTGDLAGEWSTDMSGTSQMQIDSPGLILLSGGGTLRNIRMNSGRCDVTGKYDVYGTQYFYGGHMKVRDGGHLLIKKTYQYLRLDYNDNKDTCLEILPGGIFEKEVAHCYTYIGRDANTVSRLLINGGKFIHRNTSFQLKAGGIIDVRDGEFQTQNSIECVSEANADNAQFILRGGTTVFSGSANYCPAMFRGEGTCAVVVDGTATLKYINQTKTFDSTNDVPTCVWKSTEGSRLKLIGNGNADNFFVMHNFAADGLAFDLNDINAVRKVIIDSPADPLKIGYVLPGRRGSIIANTNETVCLYADYVAPAGTTMDFSSFPADWHEGFSPIAVSNLTVDAGADISFDYFVSPYSPLEIAGTLKLPGDMNWYVNAGTARSNVEKSPIVSAAGGVVVDGQGDWACVGKVRAETADLTVDGQSLAFSYEKPGMVILLR